MAENTVDDPQGALLYVWSPRMVLSAQHAASAQRQAQLHGLAFVALHDAKVPDDEVQAALSQLGTTGDAQHLASARSLAQSQPLCAASLLERDALRHFPTAFVMRPKQPPGVPIVGAMPETAWASSIAQRLAASSNAFAPEQCIPANTFTELPAALVGSQTDTYGTTRVALGSYERISPDGRFVLRSYSGGRLGDVSLMELDATGRAVAAYDTPLSNEAFPVQGSWRYIVDVNGDHYTFNSLLRNTSKGKASISPVFRGGMTGFYAAAAELPHDPQRSPPGQVRIRSMSWPNATGDANTQGEGALVARTILVDTARQRITHDSGFVNLCNQRVRQDGPLYALPMISVDGTEFAAMPQTPIQGEPTMRIFGFGDAPDPAALGCEPRAAFSFSSGKTIFGFPQPVGGTGPTAADMAYEYRGQIWWVHRGLGGAERFNLAPYYDNPRTQLLASAFPGITRDGRIIYGATLKDCGIHTAPATAPCTERVGYVLTDPFQSNDYQAFLRQHTGPARRQCITHGDVARERAAFATLHGLENPTIGVK